MGEDGASAEPPAFVERTGAALPGEMLAPEVQVDVQVDEQEPGPAAGRPPEDWMGTAPLAALPAEAQGLRGGLPFKPHPPGTETEVTDKAPVLDPRKGETAALRNDSIMNEASRQALDAHWQMQLAASPEMRAHFENALGLYTSWLRTRSR